MTEFVVAVEDIPFGDRGVYAHRKGDKVPADNVKANGWEQYVAGPNTKAAQQATAEAAGDVNAEATQTTKTATTAQSGKAGS